MILEFSGELIYWRGPAPWHFVTVPEPESAELQEVSGTASYGWGCIPVQARIGDTGWTTSLMPREGLYVVPVKAAIRKAEGLRLGDQLTVRLDLEEDQSTGTFRNGRPTNAPGPSKCHHSPE